MKLELARRLKPGSLVQCPADREDTGYVGKVVGVDSVVFENINNVAYVLVEVQRLDFPFTKHVWPSNRLEDA